MIIGIDASRNRSGGAIIHIKSILTEEHVRKHGIKTIHCWSYPALLDQLPRYSWLIKHVAPMHSRSMARQLWWQYKHLPQEARKLNCDLVFYPCSGSLNRFSPNITISRDMLSFEKGEMLRFGISKKLLRYIVLKYAQVRSMQRADGVIFLTEYAANVIQGYTGLLTNKTIIPHGISQQFKNTHISLETWSADTPIRCIYISNASMYKHQWHVVHAIAKLRQKYNISLKLVGGGEGKAQKKLDQALANSDPEGTFVKQYPFVSHDEVRKLLAGSDLFIFASSCENMPNTLIEGMAVGLPIACSDRGPMPEVLKDGGLYFDPENVESIASAIETIICNETLRNQLAYRAKKLAEQYSWDRCADETWAYVSSILSAVNVNSYYK